MTEYSHPLVEFLVTRLAEEQTEATKAMPTGKEPEFEWGWDVLGRDRYSSEHQDALVLRWWPARILAEVHAKRQIIELHKPEDGGNGWNGWEATNGIVCTECGNVDDRPVPWPCDTLKWMGHPYQDHEGYQGAWSALAPR